MASQAGKARLLAERLGGMWDGVLAIGGVTVSELAERLGTPFYVYSGDLLEGQAQRVRDALGPETDVCFSLKANPSLGVCQLLARQGVGAEVASLGELLLAERAGFAVEDTVFAGPGKSDAELEAAVQRGLLAINVESAGELERLASTAERVGRVVSAALRVNPSEPVQGARMRMGGGAQQFGIDEEVLLDVAAEFRQDPRVRIVGIHAYPGTQIFDAEALIVHCHHVADLAARLADVLERPLGLVDFGGGFGVPYFEGMEEFDLAALAEGYRGLVRRCKDDPRLAEARLVVELGRYLTAEAGAYVTRVVDVKKSRSRTFAITDGGMNHHIMATGNFGQVFRKPYPMAVVNRMEDASAAPTTIAGPCCTPLDVFASQVPFPSVSVGDLIGVFLSGAYGYSASSLAFLSHPTPAEVLVWRGNVHILRKPGRAEQVLDGQCSLEAS